MPKCNLSARGKRRADIPPPPRSKSGCVTCRIRRKRCDEQLDANGACMTCARLQIECLGFTAKRPDWCRDKAQLDAYKLDLKKKLSTRAGIRANAARSSMLARAQAALAAEAVGSSLAGSAHSSPVHTPSFYLPASSSRVQLVEQLDLVARHLQLPASHLACTQQIIDLARWKEMHDQLGDLNPLELDARAFAIESTLATLASPSPLLGANAWDDSFLLGLDAAAPQFSSPHQQPDLSWSDIGSSAPTSPEVNVLGMTVEQQHQLFSSPLLYDPSAGDSHIPLPMLRHSPLSPMPAPLPELDVLGLGLGLSHDSCFQSFDALFANPLEQTPSPHLSISSLDATTVTAGNPDLNTTACRLLLHAVVGENANTHECLAELSQAFLRNDAASMGPDAVFAACVAACVTASAEQQKLFQDAINRLAGGIVLHLCLSAMQTALVL